MKYATNATESFIASLQPDLSAGGSASGESTDLLNDLQMGGGAGGANAATMDDKVSGVSLMYLKSPSLICGGTIGSSGCGCTVRSGTCDVEKHQKKKGLWPDEAAIFLINKGKESAVYLEPYLPVSLLPEDENRTLTYLLRETFSVESWAEYVGNYEFAAQTGINIDEVDEELNNLKASLKTPGPKSRKRQIDFETVEAELDLATQKLAPNNPVGELIMQKVKILNDLCSSAGRDPVAADTIPWIAEVAQRLQEIEEIHAASDDRIKATSEFAKAGFGEFNTQIGALNADMTRIKAQVGTFGDSSSVLKGTISEVVTQMDEIITASGVQASAANGTPLVSQDLLGRVIGPYRTSIEELARRVNGLQEGQVGGYMDGAQSNFQLHMAPRVSNYSQPGPVQAAAGAVPPRDLTWEREIEKKIQKLQNLADGVNQAGDGGVNFRGRSFSNRRDFKTWLSSLEGKSKLAISNFQCHVTLFHRIHTAMKGESRELRDAKAMSDMKVKDFDVNAVQALHILGVSPFFRGGSSSGPFTGVNTGGPKHRFGGMSTYQRYGDPSNPDGLLYRALSTLEEILRTILAEIENEIYDPEIKMLATTMLSRSEKFIRDLLQFMTDSYLEYMGSFGESDRTWDFVCECVERILTTEFREAKSLATGMDFSEPNFNIKMIWCSLNVCAAQEKFLEVGISNHPVLSSTISRYLIKNTSAGNVDSVRSTVTSHAATIASLESSISELRNQVRSAASVADKATAALKKLEKKGGDKK